MRQILTFPTWILINISRPFLPKNHLLKNKITLKNWSDNSTQLNDFISFFYWLQIPIFIIVILQIIK